MAQTQAAGGPSDPDATGGGSLPDSPELWGNNGLVGDGRYRLTHRLGRGGMAEVFGAEDLRLGRTVAVKLLRADLAEDPVSKARFTREAQSVAGLNHHSVVAVYDSGEEVIGGNITPYIVMELVEGSTIRDLLLTADAPPPDQALIIASGVLEALAYSHQHGIVHRDIKPANVIITRGGAVKVMDFGIARALHGASNTMTQTGMVMGTPQYLSPEQALGKTVDARSDLYATGCLLYELLTRRPPFTGETPLSVVYQHVQDDPVLPSEVSDAVPPELDGLTMRALAKEPDDRFQTAEEMRGLTQYALQMLHEQGGHTGGLWDTGPTAHYGGSTPAMGVPGAGARAHPSHSDTSQMGAPLLAGPRDDDGGFDGGARGGGRGGRGGGGGKGFRYALVAFLAVIAIAGGIFFALGQDNDGKDNKPDKPDTTKTEPKDKKSSDDPDPTPSETEQDQPGTSDGGTGDWTPSDRPSETGPSDTDPSPTQPSETGDPSQTHNGGNEGGGPSDGGDSGDKPSNPDSPPPGGGNENGGDNGDSGDGGLIGSNQGAGDE